jgi:cytoskeletal protein CcmA (bactofilin family)
MFGSRSGRTVIGDGLKIVGNVTAEGLIEINGQIEGDLQCTSLIVSPKAQIVGSITAERVVVNGRVEGPIQGGDVVLKSQAHVVGDIRHLPALKLWWRVTGSRRNGQQPSEQPKNLQ